MTDLVLYDYWRSSAAYRVRIALNVKGLAYESKPIQLVKGEQHEENYKALNPMHAIPALQMGDTVITQSLAIIEYLEELHPEPKLFPAGPEARAHARAMALIVAADIHPLNNLRVLRYLKDELNVTDEIKNTWITHWLTEGLQALEQLTAKFSTGRFCIGDAVSVADIFLIPNMYNARRFHCPLDAFPTLVKIDAHCRTLPAFEKASPENQPGAEK